MLDAVKLQAEVLCQRLRPAQRVDVLNVALQICKFKDCTDERSVLARYVSLCGVIAGPEADPADSDDTLVKRFLNERCAADPAGRRMPGWAKVYGLGKQHGRPGGALDF